MHDAWVKSLLNIQTHIHSWQNVGKQLSQGKADTGTLPYLHVPPNTLPTALDCQPFPALTWFGLFILSLLVGISLQLDKFLELCDRLEHIVCALPRMFRWSFGHCRRISAAGWNLVLGKSISECDSCSHRYIVVRGFSRWRQQRTCLLEQQQTALTMAWWGVFFAITIPGLFAHRNFQRSWKFTSGESSQFPAKEFATMQSKTSVLQSELYHLTCYCSWAVSRKKPTVNVERKTPGTWLWALYACRKGVESVWFNG